MQSNACRRTHQHRTQAVSYHPTMGRHISEDTKMQALRLSLVLGFKDKKIREITRVSEWTIKRVRSLYRRTGCVVQKKDIDGRPRSLNGFHISVCIFFSFMTIMAALVIKVNGELDKDCGSAAKRTARH